MLLSISARSQVGINTLDPKGIFHISHGSYSSDNKNDFIVSKEGNVGIGTIYPTAKVHIEKPNVKSIRIVDGNEFNGAVLQSDSEGYGSWNYFGIEYIPAIFNGNSTFKFTSQSTQSVFLNTGTKLVLPPGRWLVIGTFFIEPNKVMTAPIWVRCIFTEKKLSLGVAISGADRTLDTEGNNYYIAGIGFGKFSTITGSLIINNKTSSNKEYYLCTGSIEHTVDYTLTVFGQGIYLEENLIAIKIKS